MFNSKHQYTFQTTCIFSNELIFRCYNNIHHFALVYTLVLRKWDLMWCQCRSSRCLWDGCHTLNKILPKWKEMWLASHRNSWWYKSHRTQGRTSIKEWRDWNAMSGQTIHQKKKRRQELWDSKSSISLHAKNYKKQRRRQSNIIRTFKLRASKINEYNWNSQTSENLNHAVLSYCRQCILHWKLAAYKEAVPLIFQP